MDGSKCCWGCLRGGEGRGMGGGRGGEGEVVQVRKEVTPCLKRYIRSDRASGLEKQILFSG